jgi:hypothetical protein
VGKLAHIQLMDRERDLQLGAERDSLIRYRGRTNVGKLAHIQLMDRERDLQLGAERDSLIRYRSRTNRANVLFCFLSSLPLLPPVISLLLINTVFPVPACLFI